MYGEMKYKATSMSSICLGTREEQACLNTISISVLNLRLRHFSG
jgi:hypothetical protein